MDRGIRMLTRRAVLALSAALLLCGMAPKAMADGAKVPDAKELLAASDRARGGLGKGISWDVAIESTEDGQKTSKSFVLKAKGENALVETTAPSRSKGELILFNGRTIWYFKQGLRSPVSISARQRLTGQAANGDIANTNYAGDYDGTFVREEKVGAEDAYLLDLKAKGTNVTYDRIRYWVSKSNKLALKAEFLTLQGNVFKSATFEYGNTMKGATGDTPFVSVMRIVDAAFKDNVTVISYANPRAAEHADSIFNVNNLVR